MSYRVAVCYGKPTDPAAFDEYYTSTHIPLAKATPGLAEYNYGKVFTTDGTEPLYYSVASLIFPDEATLNSAMASSEMGAAVADIPNFASGGVTLFTQEEQSVLS